MCKDGAKAVKKLAGKERYDVLLIDNDLPDFNRLAFVSQARSLKHRRRTKVIMLSKDETEAEAFRAGVDQFVRKPQDLPKVPATIAGLLKIKLKTNETSPSLVIVSGIVSVCRPPASLGASGRSVFRNLIDPAMP